MVIEYIKSKIMRDKKTFQMFFMTIVIIITICAIFIGSFEMIWVMIFVDIVVIYISETIYISKGW